MSWAPQVKDAVEDKDAPESDDLRVEAQAEYRRRMGRWARDTLEVCADAGFWFVLRVVHRLHGVQWLTCKP